MSRHGAVPAARAWPALMLSPLVVALLVGCGGGRVGADLMAKPRAMDVDASGATQIELPGAGGFSITLKPVEQAPALDGDAETEAAADKQGTASAKARVDRAGAAKAAFQLGHAFFNASDRQIDIELKVAFDYAYGVALSTNDATPDAAAYLSLYVRDGHNRLTHESTFVQQTTEQGDVDASGRQEVVVPLTLAPRDTAKVFLAGAAQIDAKDGRTASAKVTVDGLKMTGTVTPAPAVPVADE